MVRCSLTALLLLITLSACGRVSEAPAPSAPDAATTKPQPSTSPASAHAATASPRPASGPSSSAAAQAAGVAGTRAAAHFGARFDALSEPDRYFFSDNYISNETSYLQVAQALRSKAQRGGAYIGVGPEQNFSYIALTEPKIAYIVDIRRGNALLHLLYKAIFHSARNRAEFVARLLGHDGDLAEDPAASLEQVLTQADAAQASAEEFERVHRVLVQYIQGDLGVGLSQEDLETLKQTHAAFSKQRLALRFELHQKNGRRYPSLRELLLSSVGPDGSFLATRGSFERLRRMQEEHRIVPVVGDFAGDAALAKIGKELQREGLAVSVFYTSNVEQYLMKPDIWARWVRNVEALPSNESSLFVRAYLDQGRRHPAQQKQHRTATLTQTFDQFKWRQRKTGYKSFWQLVNDGQ